MNDQNLSLHFMTNIWLTPSPLFIVGLESFQCLFVLLPELSLSLKNCFLKFIFGFRVLIFFTKLQNGSKFFIYLYFKCVMRIMKVLASIRKDHKLWTYILTVILFISLSATSIERRNCQMFHSKLELWIELNHQKYPTFIFFFTIRKYYKNDFLKWICFPSWSRKR